ncbi:hypothetical protein HBD75_002568 [Salmonella enterica]|nr:hypothetical protein [Salmonella enterica]EEU4804688.1 hypothetical protein [Salmonella enterica]EEU4868190.1 hypothetical protein [Salmonella enterica]EEU4895584.1 hypothetical protein [Salmonella enterica]
MSHGIIYIDYGNYKTNYFLNPLAAYITVKNSDNPYELDHVPVSVFANHDGEIIDDIEIEKKMWKSWDERVARAVSELIGKYDTVQVVQESYYKDRDVIPALMNYIVKMIPETKRRNVHFPSYETKWKSIIKNAS